MRVTVPGRYRVVFPALAGYRPLEPIVVDIAPGAFVEHTAELVRAP